MNQSLDVTFFYLAFAAYFAGLISFVIYTAILRKLVHRTGAMLMLIGVVCHTAAFFIRWYLSGHIPLSNMYEYLSLMSWMAVVMLLFLYMRYKQPFVGTFISPVVFMLMVASALLPKDINQSLMPALQSIWLDIHVSLAALGAGCFVVSFAASSLYLVKQYIPTKNNDHIYRKQLLIALICLIGIPIILTVLLRLTGITPPAPFSELSFVKAVNGEAQTTMSSINIGSWLILLGLGFIIGVIIVPFIWSKERVNSNSSFGGWVFILATIALLWGGLVEGVFLKFGWLKLTHNLTAGNPDQSVKSAWLFFEFIGAAYIFGLIISIPLIPLISRISKGISGLKTLNLNQLDEVSYKSVALGYPLYTVGALFAGAIWAEQAWGSFWSWDPKEVGALIIWLFYSGYLHARYQKGWKGSRAAILVVAGFLMLLISFFGNYFFGGLHAYT
ncbi:MAG: cytochrome c biogenesis protein CcsA [Candidatus Hatepunaea meridiana]|nr:cytochrome c biogenesis protein CcsA [Candidatus Hatepunaea meridiana]